LRPAMNAQISVPCPISSRSSPGFDIP
jgi:hypothetical protein